MLRFGVRSLSVICVLLTGSCAPEAAPEGQWRLLDDGTVLPQGDFWSFCGELTIEDDGASMLATVPYPFSVTNPDSFWEVELRGTASASEGVVEVSWTCASAAPSPKGLIEPDPSSTEVCQFFDGWWIRCLVEDEQIVSCPSDYLVGEPGTSCADWEPK